MKSIERRFNKISKRNPYWAPYICFAEAIRNQRFSNKIILYWFNKLIPIEDYPKSEKKNIITHLERLTKGPEGGIKWG